MKWDKREEEWREKGEEKRNEERKGLIKNEKIKRKDEKAENNTFIPRQLCFK